MRYKRSFSSVCEALSSVYLTDTEIAEYYRRRDRQRFVDLVKQRLFETIWRRMAQYGEKAPPFLKMEEFIRGGCKAYVKEMYGTKRAWMQVSTDRFIIYIDKTLNDIQKRTYLAHELGHTFLYDSSRVPIQPYFEKQLSHNLLEKNVYSRHEGLVYEIGRFLLIPSPVLADYIPRTASLGAFMRACETFQTSPDVMVRRLLWDTYDWQSQTSYWEDALLVIYPVSKVIAHKEPPPPRGIGEVFRGNFFKNFKIIEAWPSLIQISHRANHEPRVVINQDKLQENDRFKIEFKKCRLKPEAVYIPEHRRIYLLLY